jgi:glycerol-3-phosphate dehydrogenase (NAD(P)+)
VTDNLVKTAVLGAGSWGTALAKHLADRGHPVKLWSRRAEHASDMQASRENKQYLAGFRFPDNLRATSDFSEALEDVDYVLSVVPSQTTREVWKEAKAHLGAGVPVLCASKGIENETLAMMVTVLKETLPGHPIGFIGGPSFAKEVAAHQPTAIVIASDDAKMAHTAQHVISADWMRAYLSSDVVGVELGGALKNVIAIACGIADGLGFGSNTRAAIITRGLAEITRCATKLGADPATLAGLAGMGDLVLTCTGDLSRNRRVGIALGQGKQLDDILKEMGQVAEGVKTTASGKQLAEKVGVEMPITEEIYRVIYEGRAAKESVVALMRRSLKKEN